MILDENLFNDIEDKRTISVYRYIYKLLKGSSVLTPVFANIIRHYVMYLYLRGLPIDTENWRAYRESYMNKSMKHNIIFDEITFEVMFDFTGYILSRYLNDGADEILNTLGDCNNIDLEISKHGTISILGS